MHNVENIPKVIPEENVYQQKNLQCNDQLF